MATKMEWAKLLCAERYSSEHGCPALDTPRVVSVFHEDAERILYSSPFRRLQGKTQVHPLPKLDYLITRLTHTIEVAHVGRMIATECAKRGLGINPIDFGDIVYSACLAHDVGNPPFGHIGEYAIQTWFKRAFDVASIKEFINDDDRKNDFLHFDGNAQGFRVLTRLSGWRHSGGLQLSYATLGAFSKYPYPSKFSTPQKKKFGFMADDWPAADAIYKALGLIQNNGKFCRHPFALIVEAADDICYLTTDIEDAFRLGLLNFQGAEELLKDVAESGHNIPRYKELIDAEPQDCIAYLRAGAVMSLTGGAINSFNQNIEGILRGHFNGTLLDTSKYNNSVLAIRKKCDETIYREPTKLQIEAAGYNMIMTLMDLFGGMIDQFLTRGAENLDMRNEGLYQLLPHEYRGRLQYGDAYRSHLVLIDYISGMTDRYVLETYQKLVGSSVSLGRML